MKKTGMSGLSHPTYLAGRPYSPTRYRFRLAPAPLTASGLVSTDM
jgi:hypothetical protein